VLLYTRAVPFAALLASLLLTPLGATAGAAATAGLQGCSGGGGPAQARPEAVGSLMPAPSINLHLAPLSGLGVSRMKGSLHEQVALSLPSRSTNQ